MDSVKPAMLLWIEISPVYLSLIKIRPSYLPLIKIRPSCLSLIKMRPSCLSLINIRPSCLSFISPSCPFFYLNKPFDSEKPFTFFLDLAKLIYCFGCWKVHWKNKSHVIFWTVHFLMIWQNCDSFVGEMIHCL